MIDKQNLIPKSTLLYGKKHNLHYLPGDFLKAPKFDAHIHYNTYKDTVLKYANSVNIRLLTINVNTGFSIEKQLEISQSLKKRYPYLLDIIGTFDPSGFESENFAEEVIAQIKKCLNTGAKGIKIWKNIGMTLKDKNGKFIMIDHPVFAPILKYLENEKITLITHLGEPLNCWLPYDKITIDGDLRYYKHKPKFHMYQHPEVPSYEQQIAARDQILERYPKLKCVGAHIGSLEWNVEEVARRFDQYPRFYVDLSARMGHIQLQSLRNRKKIYDFFIKYQDRLIYGSDWTIAEKSRNTLASIVSFVLPPLYRSIVCRALRNTWQNHWLFLSSEKMINAEKFNIPNAPKTIKGLYLPQKVVDKVFYKNAVKVYNIIN